MHTESAVVKSQSTSGSADVLSASQVKSSVVQYNDNRLISSILGSKRSCNLLTGHTNLFITGYWHEHSKILYSKNLPV